MNYSREPYHISTEVGRLVSEEDSCCNPNSILAKQNTDYRNGRRALANDFQKKINEREQVALTKRGKACTGVPKTPPERPQGIRTFTHQALLSSGPSIEEPVNPQGIRLRSKKRVYGPRGALFATLQSQSYDQSALYGSIKTFGGQISKTFSHQDILFPTQKTLFRETSQGFSHLRNCDEWEQKVLRSIQHSGYSDSNANTARTIQQIPSRAKSLSPMRNAHKGDASMKDSLSGMSQTFPNRRNRVIANNCEPYATSSPVLPQLHKQIMDAGHKISPGTRKSSARDHQIAELQRQIGELKSQHYVTARK
mmetsp:Transcript_27525/g.36081  ORF Transcript_27525/g.36081 Transcript_27525/m.36081 type:complete len:309 (-) Transcript_27525:93-1019(-)